VGLIFADDTEPFQASLPSEIVLFDERIEPTPITAGVKDAKAGEGRPVEVAGFLVAIHVTAVRAGSVRSIQHILVAAPYTHRETVEPHRIGREWPAEQTAFELFHSAANTVHLAAKSDDAVHIGFKSRFVLPARSSNSMSRSEHE
jgi:hypothetical protein